ncbi:MAG: TatD family hydrolase [Bacteroidaceae bacterium]|nr:TatD family hydrolase [Bacteroidaceae bacterium]
MTIIDTHSHIYGPEFSDDVADVIVRAKEAGVEKIFLPNINLGTIVPMMELCQAYPGCCYPMMGLHPEDIGDDWHEVLDEMESLLKDRNHPYIAVGEVGLDYYWSQERYEEQKEVFMIQAGWAKRYDLPLVIHTRNAHREMVELMRSASEEESLRGVFHCFSGSSEEARELLDFGQFMLGIGGVVTFKKSQLPDVLRDVVPINRIVVETDAPYMAPVPYRGKRNESGFVKAVVEKLADIYGMSASSVAEITTNNALNTFTRARK